MITPQILHEDNAIVVINKPAGMVIHEGAGETGETVVDWYLKNFTEVAHEDWEGPERAGIVHRLDKDTSGIMVLAKTPHVLAFLQNQFKDRSTQKIYYALVFGSPKSKEGVIDTFLGRHPKRRQEQAVLPVQVGEAARREAITQYAVEKTLSIHSEIISLIRFTPKTGRMHQLRVHAKYLGTPILGDQTYTIKPAKRLSKELNVHRQLLHATELTITHPNGKTLTFTAPLPNDMQEIIAFSK